MATAPWSSTEVTRLFTYIAKQCEMATSFLNLFPLCEEYKEISNSVRTVNALGNFIRRHLKTKFDELNEFEFTAKMTMIYKLRIPLTSQFITELQTSAAVEADHFNRITYYLEKRENGLLLGSPNAGNTNTQRKRIRKRKQFGTPQPHQTMNDDGWRRNYSMDPPHHQNLNSSLEYGYMRDGSIPEEPIHDNPDIPMAINTEEPTSSQQQQAPRGYYPIEEKKVFQDMPLYTSTGRCTGLLASNQKLHEAVSQKATEVVNEEIESEDDQVQDGNLHHEGNYQPVSIAGPSDDEDCNCKDLLKQFKNAALAIAPTKLSEVVKTLDAKLATISENETVLICHLDEALRFAKGYACRVIFPFSQDVGNSVSYFELLSYLLIIAVSVRSSALESVETILRNEMTTYQRMNYRLSNNAASVMFDLMIKYCHPQE